VPGVESSHAHVKRLVGVATLWIMLFLRVKLFKAGRGEGEGWLELCRYYLYILHDGGSKKRHVSMYPCSTVQMEKRKGFYCPRTLLR
jgi:hypothetical protein